MYREAVDRYIRSIFTNGVENHCVGAIFLSPANDCLLKSTIHSLVQHIARKVARIIQVCLISQRQVRPFRNLCRLTVARQQLDGHQAAHEPIGTRRTMPTPNFAHGSMNIEYEAPAIDHRLRHATCMPCVVDLRVGSRRSHENREWIVALSACARYRTLASVGERMRPLELFPSAPPKTFLAR